MSIKLLAVAFLFPATAFAEDVGINRPGSDYRNFSAKSWQACDAACSSDGLQCKVWTYVRPGVQGQTGHCWLKNAEPAKVRDPNCVSGEGPKTF
jgi:hypothetical protein